MRAHWGEKGVTGLNPGSRLIYLNDWRIKRIKEPEHLLDDFLSVRNAEDVLWFAKKYGPLYLCGHHGIAAYDRPILMSYGRLGPSPIFGIDEPFKYMWCGPKVERRRPKIFGICRNLVLTRTSRGNPLRAANAVRLTGQAPLEMWERVDGFQGSFAKNFGRYWAYLDQPWNGLAANLERWILETTFPFRSMWKGSRLSHL
jgi:hypothetical protein